MRDATTERPGPGLADWAWAAATAAVLLPVTVAEVLREARPDGAAWAVVVLALFTLLHVLVAVRRRRPRTAIVSASAIMLALAVASLPEMPGLAVLQASSLAYLAFAYGAAASDDRVAGVAALVFGLTGAGIITGVVLLSDRASDVGMVASPGAMLALAGSLAAGVGAAWALGRYRRETLRKRAAERLAIEQAAELRLEGERRAAAEERRRIARELHDVIAHSLAVMVAQGEAARLLVGRDDDRAGVAIEHVVVTGRAAMGDMRGLLGALAAVPDVPAGAERGGGGEGSRRGASGVGASGGGAAGASGAAPIDGAAPLEPSPGVEGIAPLVERSQSPGRSAELVVVGAPVEVRPGVGLAAYRVVQESLTNTIRHAAAPSRTRVRVEWGDELVIRIDDDGGSGASAVSGSSSVPASGAGRGLGGMRERVEQAGGRFEAGPAPDGSGWCVIARLPVDEEEPR